MSKNKVKFQPVTLVLNKKELKLLDCLTGNLTYTDCETLMKQGDISYELYGRIKREMRAQEVKPVDKYIDFTITE
jgi:hypothetical protein